MSEALGVPIFSLFRRLWILEHRGSAKNHVDEANTRNLLLQVGCRSSRCARSPAVLLCIPPAHRRDCDDVYVFTRARNVWCRCDVYIYIWRTTRFVTAWCCQRCRSARVACPSPFISRLFLWTIPLNNFSLHLLFFFPFMGGDLFRKGEYSFSLYTFVYTLCLASSLPPLTLARI